MSHKGLAIRFKFQNQSLAERMKIHVIPSTGSTPSGTSKQIIAILCGGLGAVHVFLAGESGIVVPDQPWKPKRSDGIWKRHPEGSRSHGAEH